MSESQRLCDEFALTIDENCARSLPEVFKAIPMDENVNKNLFELSSEKKKLN